MMLQLYFPLSFVGNQLLFFPHLSSLLRLFHLPTYKSNLDLLPKMSAITQGLSLCTFFVWLVGFGELF